MGPDLIADRVEFLDGAGSADGVEDVEEEDDDDDDVVVVVDVEVVAGLEIQGLSTDEPVPHILGVS